MNQQSLLAQFFNEDCQTSTRNMLLNEIEKCEGKSSIREYTFNRFNLRLDFEQNKVYIEDDLNSNEDGELILPLDDFKRELC